MSTPFASDAQRQKWRQLVDEGKITQEQFDAREAATGSMQLPSRARPVKTTGRRTTDAAPPGKTLY
jgi:hypothetical protein